MWVIAKSLLSWSEKTLIISARREGGKGDVIKRQVIFACEENTLCFWVTIS